VLVDCYNSDNIKACRQTLGDFYSSLRNVCTLALDKKNLKLGGEGQIVEIDESLFARVKHKVGKDLFRKQVWVFGLVERSSGRVYFQVVPDRTAKTLLSIIYERVLPGTTVYSDCWSAYHNIQKLHKENIKHKTVNHSVNFLDKDSLACTNLIESYWCQAKSKFKEMRGCNRRFIQCYLDEFMWRNNNKLRGRDAFDQIIHDAAKVYSSFSANEIEDQIMIVNGPDETYIGDGENEKISLSEYENDDEEFDETAVEVNLANVTLRPELRVSDCEILCNRDEKDPNSDEEDRNSDLVEITNIFEQLELTKKIDKIETADHLKEYTHFNISHSNIEELVSKFISLVSFLNSSGFIVTNLNEYKRKVVHVEAEKLNLFHWTVHVNANEANLIISNNEKDREQYEVHKRKFYKNIKSSEARAIEINELLKSPSISTARRIKLQIELAAIKPTEPEPETVEVVDGILNPVIEAPEKLPPKKRGRPPKSKEPPISVETTQSMPERQTQTRYLTRSAKRN